MSITEVNEPFLGSVLAWNQLAISNIYYKNIKYSKLLNEAYSHLNISVTNIKASLIRVYAALVYNKQLNNNDDILDEVNSEFLKAGMVFIKSNIPVVRPKYPKSGIDRSEADLTVYVYVNNKFFDNIRHINPNNSITVDQLANDIHNIYSHESTHVYQNNKKLFITQPKEFNPNNSDSYYMNIREIDAHARELASNLLKKGLSASDIMQAFTNTNANINKTNQIRSESIYSTYSIKFRPFFINKQQFIDAENEEYNKKQMHTKAEETEHNKRLNLIDNKARVWKRFLRRIIDFMVLDESPEYTDRILGELNIILVEAELPSLFIDCSDTQLKQIIQTDPNNKCNAIITEHNNLYIWDNSSVDHMSGLQMFKERMLSVAKIKEKHVFTLDEKNDIIDTIIK